MDELGEYQPSGVRQLPLDVLRVCGGRDAVGGVGVGVGWGGVGGVGGWG